MKAADNGRDREFSATAQRWTVSMFASYLFMRSTASSFWSETNRFYYHWQRVDAIGVFLAILAVAGLFMLLHVICRKLGKWPDRAFKLCFVMFVGFYIKVNIGETLQGHGLMSTPVNLLMKAAVVALAVTFLVRHRRVLRGVKAVCLILSPILAVYALTLVSARPFRAVRVTDSEQVEVAGPAPRVGKICILLFDEWSYERTFGDSGQLREGFPRLAELAERSVVFHSAVTPGEQTLSLHSIPGLLCGWSGTSTLHAGELHFGEERRSMPVEDYNHIFKEMSERGYRTTVVGNYLPYAHLFKSGVDHCESWDLYKVLGRSPFQTGAGLLLENMRIRFEKALPVAGLPFDHAKNRYFADLAARIQERSVIAITADGPAFLFGHSSVPHAPFVFDGNGVLPLSEQAAKSPVEGYVGNLLYMDSLVGELLDAVEQGGNANDTLLVLVSDHGWRLDPGDLDQGGDEPDAWHVPLLVHLPGQETRIDVIETFSTSRLKDALTAYVDHEMTVDAFVELCNDAKVEMEQ